MLQKNVSDITLLFIAFMSLFLPLLLAVLPLLSRCFGCGAAGKKDLFSEGWADTSGCAKSEIKWLWHR
jgi:hypothetical protein